MFIGNDHQKKCTHTYRRRAVTGAERMESCAICKLNDQDLEVDDFLLIFVKAVQHPQGRNVIMQLLFGMATAEDSSPAPFKPPTPPPSTKPPRRMY